MPDENCLSAADQFRSQFHDDPCGKVGVQSFQCPSALGRFERSFTLTAGKRRGDFDGR